MKTGNPKQAGILAVVAVLCVVFAIFRSIPPPKRFAPPPPEDTAPELATNVKVANMPVALTQNPFDDLKDAVTAEPGSQAGSETPGGTPAPKQSSPTETASSERNSSELPVIPRVDPGDTRPANPFEGSLEKKGLTVKITAIVGVDDIAALASVDGTTVRLRVGSAVGQARVVAIEPTFIVLKTTLGRLKVSVGEEQTL